MKKSIVIAFFAVILTSFTSDREPFVGKILYKYSFTDLKGNDITEKISTYFGREQNYYIDQKNYKAYDENNNWVQLYNSETNLYYSFNKEKVAQKFDGATQTSKTFKVTKLDLKEKIAGYDCIAIQVESDNSSTIYYYSPLIKTDSKVFSKHNFGEWNKYLEATDGALALKFVLTNLKHGYVWTSIASEVSKANMTSNDFVFPTDMKLKN